MNIYRHTRFLKDVFLYTIVAFGGPQAHLGLMNKYFVQKRNYLSESELLEYFSFCQLLPGASSTQLLGIIAFKRGGILLSIITLLIWILPACIMMSFFAVLISDHTITTNPENILRFIPSLTAGFLFYAGIQGYKNSINNTITFFILLGSSLIAYFYFKIPWIFPILILSGGILTNFSKKRIPEKEIVKPKQIKWSNILIFILLFLVAGFLSENARKNNWSNRKSYNLFENFYRFGSFVFGGGDVLLPMMLDQYVARPTDHNIIQSNPNVIKMDKKELLTGYGLVRAIPGPVFSVSAYCGAIAFKNESTLKKISGSAIAAIGIFLPSVLLMFFFFPVWQFLKKYVVVHRAMEGIYAVATGLIFAGLFYLIKDINFPGFNRIGYSEIAILLLTILYLNFTKFPPPLLVITVFILGFIL